MTIAPRFRSRGLALLTAGAAALALAGCSGTPSQQAGGGTVTVTASSAPSSSAPAPSGSPSASAPAASVPASTSTSGYRVDRCAAADLRGSLGSGEGAAGSTIVDLALQNTGSGSCTLQGWPGVSFVTAGGKQIGAAADFDRSSVHETVTLMPGAHAHASLKIADAQNYPTAKCGPTASTRLRVYPPGSTESIVVTTSTLTACSVSSVHLLTVQALHATT